MTRIRRVSADKFYAPAPKLLLRETGSWSFQNRIPKLELGNQQDLITKLFKEIRVDPSNPRHLRSIPLSTKINPSFQIVTGIGIFQRFFQADLSICVQSEQGIVKCPHAFAAA